MASNIKCYITGLLMSAASIAGAAQVSEAPVRITAETDSIQMIMGSKAQLHVSVNKPTARPGLLVNDLREGGMLGDVEIVSVSTDSSVLGGGRTRVNYDVTFQAFDPGEAQIIPPLTYVTAADSASTDPIALKVFAVDVDSLKDVHVNTEPVEYELEWYDYIPQSWPWWLLGVIVAALIVGALLFLFRRDKVVGMFRKPVVPPYEMAMQRLDSLRQSKLAVSGNDKQYFTELTDILRQYLSGRFGIKAPEMTTVQVLQELKRNGGTADYVHEIKEVLDVADSVKFAKFKTSPTENYRALDEVEGFVSKTRPMPEPEKGNEKTKSDNTAEPIKTDK